MKKLYIISLALAVSLLLGGLEVKRAPTPGQTATFGDGVAADVGRVEIGGTSDDPALVIEGHSTQTEPIIRVFQSDGTVLLELNNDGTLEAEGFYNVTDNDAAGIATNGDIFGETILAGAVVATSAGGEDLAVNTITLATAVADYDLPDCETADVGDWVHVIVRDVAETVSVTVANDAANDIILYKGVGTLIAGDELDSPGAIQDSVTLVCMVADTWYVTANSGAWTDGGADD